jgi:hypothetical protein
MSPAGPSIAPTRSPDKSPALPSGPCTRAKVPERGARGGHTDDATWHPCRSGSGSVQFNPSCTQVITGHGFTPSHGEAICNGNCENPARPVKNGKTKHAAANAASCESLWARTQSHPYRPMAYKSRHRSRNDLPAGTGKSRQAVQPASGPGSRASHPSRANHGRIRAAVRVINRYQNGERIRRLQIL